MEEDYQDYMEKPVRFWRVADPIDPVEARLAEIELQMDLLQQQMTELSTLRMAEIERKLDNLVEYVRSLMTNNQKLRCTPPGK